MRLRRCLPLLLVVLAIFSGGCTESDAEIAARKTIAAERARLKVVASTAKAVRGGQKAAADEAADHARAFDYKALNAPVGAQLALYRTAEGAPAKEGVALLKGAGDFSAALKAMSRLSPAADTLVVEGVKATAESFAATLGFERPSPPVPTSACAVFDQPKLTSVAAENVEIAALLNAGKDECAALRDVFAAVDLNKKNLADRRAREGLERVKALRPLFAALAPLVEGEGEVFRFPEHLEVKGCAKEALDTAAFKAALVAENLAPAFQKSLQTLSVDACRFALKIETASATPAAPPTVPVVKGAP